jgi:hypothetical protein
MAQRAIIRNLVECVPRVILARVLQFGKAGDKPFHGAFGGESHGSNRFRDPRRNPHFGRDVKCDSSVGLRPGLFTLLRFAAYQS